MADFEAAIQAQMDGAAVAAATLVSLDFVSGTRRLWSGAGPLSAGGQTWDGVADLGRVEAIAAGPGQAAEEVTLSIFAAPEALAHFSDDAAETAGREAAIYLQFLDLRDRDENGNWVRWQTLGSPVQLFAGTMGPLIVERPPVQPGERATRVLSVRAVNPLVNRRRPAFGFYTDRDQQARHPGDRIFCNISRLANGQVAWPFFN